MLPLRYRHFRAFYATMPAVFHDALIPPPRDTVYTPCAIARRSVMTLFCRCAGKRCSRQTRFSRDDENVYAARAARSYRVTRHALPLRRVLIAFCVATPAALRCCRLFYAMRQRAARQRRSSDADVMLERGAA